MRSSSSAWASSNCLPHSRSGLLSPWKRFSRPPRVSPISASTLPSSSLPLRVTSRICLSFFSRSARCLSFSRVWITWLSDCSSWALLIGSPPAELPASGLGSAAWLCGAASRPRSRQNSSGKRKRMTGKVGIGTREASHRQ
ncbi:hypothetical protein D3C85_1479850 [compost metagenome]